MIPEQHLRIAANMVSQRYGDWAPAFVASRIAALDEAGDSEGAITWCDIMGELGRMRSETPGICE